MSDRSFEYDTIQDPQWEPDRPDQNNLPAGYVPCTNPRKLMGYISIEEIFAAGTSVDFYVCLPWGPYWMRGEGCPGGFCEHNMNMKRRDTSYQQLRRHLEVGGGFTTPVQWEGDRLGNGHHRVIAAYDAGFTHVPYQYEFDYESDWSGTTYGDEKAPAGAATTEW